MDLARTVAIGAEISKHRTIRGELLDAVVAPIGDVDVAHSVQGNRLRDIELAGARPLTTKDLLDLAVRTVAGDGVSRLVQDIHVVAGAIYGDADRRDHPARLTNAIAALPGR